MFRRLVLVLTLLALATPAFADIHFLAYDASDRITQALTRGVTLEVNRGLFGAISVRRIISTSARGEAQIRRGGPDQVRSVLPNGSREANIYEITSEGDGPRLVNALCPTASEAWVVTGRVQMARPLTMHAVGRWPDGTFRHCVTLSYAWRGEWAMPAADTIDPQ